MVKIDGKLINPDNVVYIEEAQEKEEDGVTRSRIVFINWFELIVNASLQVCKNRLNEVLDKPIK